MGAPPAPPYATIYYGIHEDYLLHTYCPELFFYKRFIDDVIGIWVPSSAECWHSFIADLSYGNLTWDVSQLSSQVHFMDLTITLQHQSISTTLFEKELNLYLYIPPHSAHPPGVLHGLVIGNIVRIYNLCSNQNEAHNHILQFY